MNLTCWKLGMFAPITIELIDHVRGLPCYRVMCGVVKDVTAAAATAMAAMGHSNLLPTLTQQEKYNTKRIH